MHRRSDDSHYRHLVQSQDIIVTGGAGFIGLHLVERLLGLGAKKVTILDNLKFSSRGFIDPILANPAVELIRFDIGIDDPERLSASLRQADYLFHLAAEKHNQSIDAPQRLIAVNVAGTHDLLAAAARAGIRKVVFASSLYANGRMKRPPLSIEETPSPRTVYGMTKVFGEHLLHHFADDYGMGHAALRLFFVYGPRQYPGTGYKSVIQKNFERILSGKPPIIFGDGRQTLDYVYIDDVVAALIRALDKKADGRTMNVGTGRAISVNELTALMLATAGSSLEPVIGDRDGTHGTYRVCLPGPTETLLDWRPEIPIEEGIRRVFEWMKSQTED